MSAHRFYETVTESDVSSYHGNVMNAETGINMITVCPSKYSPS